MANSFFFPSTGHIKEEARQPEADRTKRDTTVVAILIEFAAGEVFTFDSAANMNGSK
jgi:hypothetical protein